MPGRPCPGLWHGHIAAGAGSGLAAHPGTAPRGDPHPQRLSRALAALGAMQEWLLPRHGRLRTRHRRVPWQGCWWHRAGPGPGTPQLLLGGLIPARLRRFEMKVLAHQIVFL